MAEVKGQGHVTRKCHVAWALAKMSAGSCVCFSVRHSNYSLTVD